MHTPKYPTKFNTFNLDEHKVSRYIVDEEFDSMEDNEELMYGKALGDEGYD